MTVPSAENVRPHLLYLSGQDTSNVNVKVNTLARSAICLSVGHACLQPLSGLFCDCLTKARVKEATTIYV